MRIAVIRNPNANKNKRGKNPKDALERILDDEGMLIETRAADKGLENTTSPKNFVKLLEEAVEECAKHNVEILCSDGGDGTARYILTKLVEVYSKKGMEFPVFVPLTSGTVNFAANGLGIKGSPVEILEKIVESNYIATKEVDILQIDCSKNKMYGFVYGMGAIPNFLEKYYDRSISGFLSYNTSIRKAGGLIFKSILSHIFGTKLAEDIIKPIYVQIKVGEYFCSKHTAVVASTIPINVIGLKPFHNIIDERKGVYFLCGDFDSSTILRNIHNVFLGKRIVGKGLYLDKVKWSDIEMMIDEDDCNLTIDGELYKVKKGDTINLSVGPSIRVPKF